ncbi:MAG: methyltransferase type 11 [Acidobacteria bacterium]|nr:MAG: methyltransferase type 11 [Acidobacteriota bacterium]PYQ21127.1 MAG: methyltransferase type 11 [Acidobacteriota bacterium]
MNPEEYQRMFEAEETQWWYAGMRAISLALLSPELPARPDSVRILDAGCGTGNNLRHLARHGRAVGVDLSDEALRFCRARGVAAAKAELLALPFPDASFDCVTSFDVLYHRWVADDRAAVAEMARVLRPGGVLLVRVPALKMLWGAHDEAVHSRHRYTPGEVKALLGGAGLEVVRVVFGNSFLFPLAAARRALDRVTGRHGSDVSFLPGPLEWAFRSVLRLEARLVGRVSFPVGTSVFALARRPRVRGSVGASGYNSAMETRGR